MPYEVKPALSLESALVHVKENSSGAPMSAMGQPIPVIASKSLEPFLWVMLMAGHGICRALMS